MPAPPRSRPYVVVNMAITADGKIATASGDVASFGSARDHRLLLELRAGADAVLCGARTANAPGVTLSAGGPRYRRLRRRRRLAAEHLRIIVSGRARLRPDAGVFAEPGAPIIVLAPHAAPPRRVDAWIERGATVGRFGRQRLDLAAALAWLARDRGVRRLVCEGGGELNDAMFRAGLVDEVRVTLCPLLLGGRDAPTLAGGEGFPRLAKAARLSLRSVRRVGDELYLNYLVVGPAERRPPPARRRTRPG